MKCVRISHLKESQLSKDLAVYNSKIIIDSLVEDHMVNNLIDLFSNCSNLFNTILVNVFKKFINLIVSGDFLNKIT